MKLASCIIIALLFFSCGKQSAINKKLSGSDSLVITFNAHNSDSVIGIVNSTERKAIRKLTHFLEGDNTMQYKCGYDGNMVFYRKGEQILAVVLNYSEEGCRSFFYDMDNILISTRMNKEATSFLKSLSEGKGWY